MTMRRCALWFSACVLAATAVTAPAQAPPAEKRLIIHADDLALAHSVNVATFKALDSNAVTSASVMAPCPWLTEVGEYARKHPEADLGIHLTLTAEWKNYRWGPVGGRGAATSLVDPNGYLWPESGPAQAHIKPDEAAAEIRAQVEMAQKLGIRPTHLDSHMGTMFTAALLPIYVGYAREAGIRFFALRTPGGLPAAMAGALRETDEIPTSVVMASQGWKPERWPEHYEEVVRNLKPGLTELIVHLAFDDAEMQAVAQDHPAFGSAWRQRDFDVLTSARFKKALADNNVKLVGWKDLRPITR